LKNALQNGEKDVEGLALSCGEKLVSATVGCQLGEWIAYCKSRLPSVPQQSNPSPPHLHRLLDHLRLSFARRSDERCSCEALMKPLNREPEPSGRVQERCEVGREEGREARRVKG
jgi:hypothetical protein